MPDDAVPFQSPLDRTWLRAIGATLLSAIMLLAAYSLIADTTPDASSPGAAARPAGQATSSRAPSIAVLSNAPDVSGTISAVTPRALTIATQTGPRVVRIDDDTKVIVEDGASGVRDDLVRGMAVAVVSTTEDGGRTFTAVEIAILPR